MKRTIGKRRPGKGVGDKKGTGDMYPESGNWRGPYPI
jgi:hypothetical protein